MLKTTLLTFALVAAPALAWAQCTGTDIRADLSDEMRDEIAAAVAQEPNPTGNFWRATKDGRTITLVGTVHIDDPRLDPIARNLNDEISAADVVFLEMTEREQDALQSRLATDVGMIMLAQGSLIDMLPAARWEQLKASAEERGIPGMMAARMQPWYLSLVLAMPPCVLADGQPEGLDAMIEDTAAASQVPTQALEPYDTLFTLFAEEPMQTQLDFLAASVMDTETSENMLATTLNSYFEGGHAELWHLSRIMARDLIDLPQETLDTLFDELEEALLVERNKAWIAPLTGAAGDEVFAAFGAAHLFGANGIIALLQAEGYDVAPFTP
ncbi:TraB/GumN family protein [Roseobacteraceae bacterium S113]